MPVSVFGVRVCSLAVKIYETGHSADRTADVMREVMWEVHVLRQIRQPQFHVATLLDAIEFPDAAYVVMERYNGPDLQEYIQAQPSGVLSEARARRFFCHMLAGIRHAHTRGFLHCDVKPANVRLNAACDVAVVVDWGMARSIHTSRESISRGTPSYASPEQLTGHNPEQAWGMPSLGPAADVWSLGASLHQMIRGGVPFGGDSFEELIGNVMRRRYKTSRSGRPVVDASAAAQRVIDSMLQILPSERASIDELCADPWVVVDGHLPPPVPLPPVTGIIKGADALVAPSPLRELMLRHQDTLLKVGYALLVVGTLLAHSYYAGGEDALGLEHDVRES